jgi:hypothetical protein
VSSPGKKASTYLALCPLSIELLSFSSCSFFIFGQFFMLLVIYVDRPGAGRKLRLRQRAETSTAGGSAWWKVPSPPPPVVLPRWSTQ